MSLNVSVVIPVFNGESTIERAIRSVQEQTRSVLEIIVIDDASSDATGAILERLAQASKVPLNMVTNSRNAGPGISRNAGWSIARGHLIAFLDADDVWHPQKLEIQVPLFESYPELVMACHDRSVGAKPLWQKIDSTGVKWREFAFGHFLIRNRCATPSVVVRKSIPERFTTSLRYAEDFHLWLTLTSTYGPASYTPEVLVHCANPSYGGMGLSGNLWMMFKSEIRALLLLTKSARLSWLMLPLVIAWSSLKFGVRVVDNRMLRNRLQTVSESR